MKKNVKNIATGLSILVLFFFALSYYSHLVYNAAIDGKDSGFIAHHLTNFSNYPNLIKEVLASDELAGIPPSYLKPDSSFESLNHLSYDLYAVNSFWNMDANSWDIKLFNLKNDSVLFKWTIAKDGLNFETTDWSFPNSTPRNCIIFPDKSILFAVDESANLVRLNAASKPLWINKELIYHHSLNLDADSNIWVCTSDPFMNKKPLLKGINNFDGVTYKYKENYITQIDRNTGKIIFHKGISQILKDNHYENFMFGFQDPFEGKTHDPIHLNDIEPLCSDSEYWKKGDLLISIRHRSLIMLYRPSTNKITRLIYGDFINQHDVDVFSGSEISIFNNNFIRFNTNKEPDSTQVLDSIRSSEIVIYNLKDSTCKTYLKKNFLNERIWTETQGLHQKLSNGDVFVESQNEGKIFIMNDSGFVMKKTLPAPMKDYCYLPNWIRVYEKIPY